jgi:hypothetical protein
MIHDLLEIAAIHAAYLDGATTPNGLTTVGALVVLQFSTTAMSPPPQGRRFDLTTDDPLLHVPQPD